MKEGSRREGIFSIFLIVSISVFFFFLGFFSHPSCLSFVRDGRSLLSHSLKDSFSVKIRSLQRENLFLKEKLGAYEDVSSVFRSHHDNHPFSVKRFSVQLLDHTYRYYGFIFANPRSKQGNFSVHYSIECVWVSPSGVENKTVCVSSDTIGFRYFAEVSGTLPLPQGQVLKRVFFILQARNFLGKWVAYPPVPNDSRGQYESKPSFSRA